MKPSTDNVFNWNTGAPSIFAADTAVKATTTMMRNRSIGKVTDSGNASPMFNLPRPEKKPKKAKHS